MALYYDAAAILSAPLSSHGSLRSRVYDNNIVIKSSPSLIYGLIIECAKWDSVLSEVIDNAAIISHERKVCWKSISAAIALLTDTEALWLADSAACSTPRT